MLVDQRGAKGLPSRKATQVGIRRRPGTDLALTKTPAQTSAENEAKTDALRAPLIHLLALGSDTERNIALKTHAPVDLCLKILQRIGNRTRAGNHWELVDDVYRDLDLWKFPYGSQKEREIAIENAKKAFVRLRLPSGAPEWDLLVKPEDRGKVKIGPPPPSLPPKPKPLPSLNVTKVDEGRLTPAEASPTASENSVGAEQLARSNSSQPPNKTRRVGEKDRIDKIIANRGKPQKAKKEAAKEKKVQTAPATGPKKLGRPPKPKSEAPPKPTKRPTKWKHPEGGVAAVSQTRESQYKSEKFVESDSEPEVSIKAAGKSPMAARVAGKSPLPTTSHGQARVDPPKASSNAASPAKKKVAEVARVTKPTTPPIAKKSVAAKTLPAKTSELASEKLPKERPIAKATGAVGGKRPVAVKSKAGEKEQPGRTTSPAKRSPVGASPVVTGQEAGSVASTPKTLSSIGTVSTPSRSPMNSVTSAPPPAVKKQPRYAQETSSTTTKRKAERIEEDAPKAIKRQRLPDASTLNMARRFKEEYAKYARLYKEAQNTSDGPLQTERLNRVLKMHRELAAMKSKLVNLAAA